LVGERKKRLRQPEIQRFSALLHSLPVPRDMQPIGECLRNILPLGVEYGLSACDAAYLELSIRHGASLATLDDKLAKAAKQARVPSFSAKG